MTDTSAPGTRSSESDFRVGRVFSRTSAVFSRNFVSFFAVTLIAGLPNLVFIQEPTRNAGANPFQNLAWLLVAIFLALVLGTLSQAIVLYGAFQDMRGQRVNLGDSLRIGLGRFFPIIGLAICYGLGVMIGSVLLVVPGFILLTMWYVATPACVVERLGPIASLRRSRQLTKGHRWKIFGMLLLLIIAAAIVGGVLQALLRLVGGTPGVLIGSAIWNGIWGAFYAIFVVVTYHDLRVAKEGIGTDQIAAVFD